MNRWLIRVALTLIVTGLGISAFLGVSSRAQEETPKAVCMIDPAINEALVNRWYEEVWSGGDLAALDEIVVDDHMHHWAVGADTTGREPIKERVAGWRVAMPDLQIIADEVIAREDLVAVRWTASGTNTGKFQEREATGKAATWTGINVFRVECGQFTEVWSEMDALGFYEQLGVMAK